MNAELRNNIARLREMNNPPQRAVSCRVLAPKTCDATGFALKPRTHTVCADYKRHRTVSEFDGRETVRTLSNGSN